MLGIIVLIAIIVIDWFAAQEFYKIAKMKGHYEKKYMWWCFLFAWAGYLMVLALPNKINANSNENYVQSDLPEL